MLLIDCLVMTNLFYPSLSVYLQRRAPGPSVLPFDGIFSHPPALPRVTDRLLWEGDGRWNARPVTGQGDELYMMRVAWNGHDQEIRNHLAGLEGCVRVDGQCLMLEHGESAYRGVTIPIWRRQHQPLPTLPFDILTEPRARRSRVGQYRLEVCLLKNQLISSTLCG